MNKLTEIEYWQDIQGSPSIDIDDKNVIKLWIEKNIDIKNINRCIEIGCYPGRYLSIFGKYGVELNGIDYIPQVSKLSDLYKNRGYKTGQFYCLDFHEHSIQDEFDCVYSLGFIEHFNNWESVFTRHLDLVSKDGFLIVEVPNFGGWMQRLPRLLFDRENYFRHNTESMDLDLWIDILKKNDFEIIKAESIGGYMLWFEKKCGKRELLLRRIFVRFMRLIQNIIYAGQENHPSFSGALGVIARKRG